MNNQEVLTQVLESLAYFRKEHELSQRSATLLDEISMVLQEDIDVSLRVDRVRGVLKRMDGSDELSMQARTQLWSISSMLDLLE